MENVLNVESRASKHVIRPNQLRQKGFIPGVIYGKGIESVPIKVGKYDLMRSLDKFGQVFEVKIDGKKRRLVNLEKVQKDPLGKETLHVAFHELKRGEETAVSLPIQVVGESPGDKQGGVITQPLKEVEVTGMPQNMPEAIEVDISQLGLNESIQLKDIQPPQNMKFDENLLEETVVNCAPPSRSNLASTGGEASSEESSSTEEGDSNESNDSAEQES